MEALTGRSAVNERIAASGTAGFGLWFRRGAVVNTGGPERSVASVRSAGNVTAAASTATKITRQATPDGIESFDFGTMLLRVPGGCGEPDSTIFRTGGATDDSISASTSSDFLTNNSDLCKYFSLCMSEQFAVAGVS